ncbi:MAG: LLM class F420-dependent oxidoreductase [Actinomycetota bacterium]|nr:LLM class F420-dependent oxidoreductase [Actinomycetota bacterium]
MIRTGLQIPSFSFPAPDAELFGRLSAMARAAETSGFDSLYVMDHFYQLPMLGAPQERMLEAYTLLGGLAAATEQIQLGTLVTGNTYRNPALLAKIITTLDIVSSGRAILGIGAGWFELEHDAMGIEFGTFTDRFDKLEEALAIILPMLDGKRPSLDGERYRVKDVINSPLPVRRPPLLIGGSGERKTLRIAAEHAQHMNLTSGRSEVAHKVEVLEGHLATVGRDRSDIEVSMLGMLFLGATHEEAVAKRDARLATAGMTWEQAEPLVGDRFFWGDPDEVTAQIAEVRDAGLDALIVNMVSDGDDTDAISLAGEVLSKAFT